jgi:four helix bundle protein
MNFEDLDVWRRSVDLSVQVYRELNNLKDFGFRDQITRSGLSVPITRSGLSVPSNIAEGFERESDRDCLKFLHYAKGSCGELRTQVYIGIEIGYIQSDKGEEWIQEAKEISRMIGGLIRSKKNFLSKGENRG